MLDACTHFTYTILMKKSNKETVHFCFSISRKMPITSHIFVPLLVHLFDVMLWHIYNIMTITWRKMCVIIVCIFIMLQYVYVTKKTMLITNYDNIFVKCNLHPKMFHSLYSLKMRFMCCHYYHIDHYWPLFL